LLVQRPVLLRHDAGVTAPRVLQGEDAVAVRAPLGVVLEVVGRRRI